VVEGTGLRILTGDALREPLRAALAGRAVVRATASSATASAVLVPLFERQGEAHVWLVRRASSLRRHGGQVAFPGGKADVADVSELATALREAHEEIGLSASAVDVLGRLDDLVTGTGFKIAPFVGWVNAAFTPKPNESEVARVFGVPLRAFFARASGIPPFQGHDIDGERVWGATGKVLRDLARLVRPLEAAP